MADTNLTSVAGLLKRVYDSYVEDQQNLKHRTIDSIAKGLEKASPGGSGFYLNIRDYGNESGGAINEEEQFRTIDSEHYQQPVVIPKIQAWPIQFSGLVSKAADSDVESFANAVVDALDSARERCLKDENRQFFGLGTGVLCSPANAVASNLLSFTVDSAQYLRANMVIDIFTSAGGAAVDAGLTSRRIIDVDKVNNLVYLSASLGFSIATTNVIGKENIFDSMPADGKEMMGLRGIVDDSTDLTTFEGINATTVGNLIWRSRRINASSANLTSDLLQRLIDDVRVLGGEEPDTLLMHPAQRRKYLDIVVPQKRYMDGKMDAGFDKLSFNGMELILDEDCQIATVYAIKKSMIRKYELAPLAMGTHDGSDVFMRLANYDVFQAYWRHYCNFGTSKRTAHGKIVSLATPSAVA
jgi:hypothetical protein